MLRFPPVKSTLPQVGEVSYPVPTGGLNFVDPIMGLGKQYATELSNFTIFSTHLERRWGVANWTTTDLASTVKRLHVYAAVGATQTLWATTDDGVFDVSTSGAAPAASIALTEGVTQSAILSTGANNYMILVNGVDSMVSYDGATWTSTATVGGGAINTNTFKYVEVYRQRVFFIVENSTRIVYLNANSPTGGGTTYDTAAIFRKGGNLVALGTWTIDGGTGPDDHLVLVTSEGEVAVFSGNDPATWSYKGTYFIAPPLGLNPLFKFGGDLLYACNAGIYPLSRALLVATLDRSAAITNKINPVFTGGFSADSRYQLSFLPTIPALVFNTADGSQYLMNTVTGGWFSWSSSDYDAECVAYYNSRLYIGQGLRVASYDPSRTRGFDLTGDCTSTYTTGYARLTRTTSKIEGLQPIITMDSVGGAPPPGTIAVGTLTVARVVFAVGTGVIQYPSITLYGGDIPTRTVSRWYMPLDDFSMWKQFSMTWDTFVPERYYGMAVTYTPGRAYTVAGLRDTTD